MPSDTYILTISEAGVSVPSNHAGSHISGGTDVIPTATTTASGLMSAAIFNEHVINTAKVENKTHTGDVTDLNGALTVNKIKGVDLSSFSNNSVLKVTTGGVIAAATAADYPTLNQSTTGNALTATTATKATNVAGGATGSLPYQTANDSTSMLSAGTSGTVLKSNGAAPPSWSAVEKSMLSTALSNEITASTNKTDNITHSGDVTDAGGVLTITKINGTPLASFNAATATSATTATTATKSTNLVGGTAGSIPYQSTVDSTQMLSAGTSGTVLKSNGAAPPSWSAVEKSMLSTALSNEITASTNKTDNITHSGDVTDTGGVLKVTKINNVQLSTLGTGILKNTTGTGVPSIATAADFPTSTVSTGGTGITSYSIGDLLYASTNTTLDKLTSIAAGNVLTTNGTNNAPSYGKVALSGAVTHVTGTLPVSSGGTGATSLTGYVKGSGTGNLTASATVPNTDISGTLTVSQGGTGAVTLNGYVKGSGTGNLTASATVPVGDISGTLLVTQGGTGATTATGTGSVVLASSPSLTTPNLGTPSAGTLTSCTGLPIDGGTTGTLSVTRGGTGTTSLNGYVKGTGTGSLSAVSSIPITDLSGSIGVANGGTGQSTFTSGILNTIGGANAFTTITQPAGDLVGTTETQTLTNKTLTAPALGTPTSGTLTNCTGLPLDAGTTGTLPASRITGLPTGGGGATVPATAGYVKSDGTALTSVTTIPASDITGLTGGGDAVVPTTSGVVTSDGNQLLSSTTLPVSLGGTGAGTLTGYVKGNGTGAMTAAATIPATDISGTIPTSIDLETSTGTLAPSNGGTGHNHVARGIILSPVGQTWTRVHSLVDNALLIESPTNISTQLLSFFSAPNPLRYQFKYTGSSTSRTFRASCVICYSAPVGARNTFSLVKNTLGVQGSASINTGTGAVQSIVVDCFVQMSPNDTLGLFSEANISTNTITFHTISFNISALVH